MVEEGHVTIKVVCIGEVGLWNWFLFLFNEFVVKMFLEYETYFLSRISADQQVG